MSLHLTPAAHDAALRVFDGITETQPEWTYRIEHGEYGLAIGIVRAETNLRWYEQAVPFNEHSARWFLVRFAAAVDYELRQPIASRIQFG